MRRHGQQYWHTLATCGGCESKAQSIAVRLFLNPSRDGWIPLNGKGVPMGRTYQRVADLLNEMGLRTKEGEVWKRTRTQQVLMNGLARSAAFHAIFLDKNERKLGRDFEEAIRDAEEEMWALFKRKGKAVRNGEAVNYGTVTVNGESRVCDRPALGDDYWAKKKLAARKQGWKSPEPWFSSPPEEKYETKRRTL